MFAIEALKARHGDCLLVHFGDANDSKLILIDGGPSRTYRESLRPRLEQLLEDRRLAALPLELLMVSHIDEDHIEGLVYLCRGMLEGPLGGPAVEPKTLWHNTFGEQSLAAAEAAGDDEAVLEMVFAEQLDVRSAGQQAGLGLVISSVGQSDDLADLARDLRWSTNDPFKGLVRSDAERGRLVELDGINVTVLAPNAAQLVKLKEKWPRDRSAMAAMAADPDDSPFNLSSIVCLLETDRKTALMTGDALDSDILKALEDAELLDDGEGIALDLLKLPHHGSSRNASREFFERVRARNYLISADGKYGNPDPATLGWLLDARPDDEFTLHLTYRELIQPAGMAPIEYLLEQQARGRGFGLEFPADGAESLTVRLSD